ncbi:hypothetical protein CPB85DRAFT_375227 [Mucidula mucida]|nr:hypothetical protein CPB85DRAFT_375227 [Mucidula mucida]
MTRTYCFKQKKYDGGGTIVDLTDGGPVWKLYEKDDEKFFGSTFKDSPTKLTRASDKGKIGAFDFSKERFKDSAGIWGKRGRKLRFLGDIFNDNLAFILPSTGKFEWDTYDNAEWRLLSWSGYEQDDDGSDAIRDRLPVLARLRIRHGWDTEFIDCGTGVGGLRLLEASIVTALILHYINDNDGPGMSKKLSYRESDGPGADDSDEGDGDDYGGR